MATYLSESNTNQPEYYDPLGTDTGTLSGQSMRTGIYNQLSMDEPKINEATNAYVSSLENAANNPARGDEMNYESDVLSGKYLNGSPALDEAMSQMRAQSGRSTADTNAKTASQYAQNGMSFGTGAQEAQLANQALNTSQANQTEANTRLSNYQTERGYQNSAPSEIETLISEPSNYLSKVSSAYLDPLTSEGNIVHGLSSGGTVSTPVSYQTTSGASQIMSSL